MKRHRTPTAKQIKALQLMNQGMSRPKALREAGYSRSYAAVPAQFLSQPVIKAILIGMKDELVNVGLSQKYMAGKIAKWMEAKKDDDDDYDVQMKAYDKWKDMMDYSGADKTGSNGVKRKLEITEYILGEDATQR